MNLLKKVLLGLLFLLLICIAYLFYNTFTFTSTQQQYPAIAELNVDQSPITHLAEALTIKTISPENERDFDSTQFQAFTGFLERTYPLADSLLVRKTFNEFSHLYTWQGSDAALNPIVLMAHLDVVPVMEENMPDWKVDPFGGEIVQDTLWGRGAIDDKIGVIGTLEAVERLLREGFQPQRTLYLAFGHDEEIGGVRGAKAIAQHLEQQGVEAELVLDEGGFIVQGLIPGLTEDAALIGIAEKGFVSVHLSIKIPGGHSSTPERESAIDILSRAITRLKDNPFPASISPPIEGFINSIGPEMPFANKLVFANHRLFESVITGIYEQSNSGSALVRTTTAPTIFHSGVKENVIPQVARATVNFRIMPGSSIQEVVDRVHTIINDDRIAIEVGDFLSEPSPVSNTESEAYEVLRKTIGEIYPEVLIAPYLVVGGTDSRYFTPISDNVYRFSAVKLNRSLLKSFHGINERIAVGEVKNVMRFYYQLILNSTSAP